MVNPGVLLEPVLMLFKLQRAGKARPVRKCRLRLTPTKHHKCQFAQTLPYILPVVGRRG